MQEDVKPLSSEIEEKVKKFWEAKPQNDEAGLVFYPCNSDWKLVSSFWDYPGQTINTKLLDKDSSFKIVSGDDISSYRGRTLYKRGTVLYKYFIGGKREAGVEAYLIRPNTKNPKQPRLCKFLSFHAERHNKVPGITVTETGTLKSLSDVNLEHPIFPFKIYEGCETGFFQLVKSSLISKEEQQRYAKIKAILISLEQGKSVKSNDFSSAVRELGLSPLTLDPKVISEEMTKEVGTVTEDEKREKRQKEIWVRIDKAFNAKQDSKELRIAKSFVPNSVEELVLKIYYLQCQFELDEDAAGEIFQAWFEQHSEDSKQIEQFTQSLYKERFDQGRLDIHLIYSKDETTALLKRTALELQSKAKNTIDKPQEATPEVTPKPEEKVKLKRRMESSGDPSFFVSQDIDLKHATVILKQALIPYIGKDPGKWYKLTDDKVTVFEIGVSESIKKPGLVYKEFQIQLESASSPLTIFNKEKIVEVNGKKLYETLTGPDAEKQIIVIAKVLENYTRSKMRLENSACLIL